MEYCGCTRSCVKPRGFALRLVWRDSGVNLAVYRCRAGGFFGVAPFYRNRCPPSSLNALCASALALRAPYYAQSAISARLHAPCTFLNEKPLV